MFVFVIVHSKNVTKAKRAASKNVFTSGEASVGTVNRLVLLGPRQT